MDPDLAERAEAVLGHTFADRTLLKESLTHTSVADDRLDSNERMEFLGDSVLDLVVCAEIFRRFPQMDEGDMTKIKSAVVSRRTCAEVAVETGLSELLRTGRGMFRHELPMSLSANVYEAVVAAIYLDGGFAAAEWYVRRTMVPKIKAVSDNTDAHNFKSVLQAASQRLLGNTPQYLVLDEKGPDHGKCFEVCASVSGRRFRGAWAMNKKIAEQKAAVFALEELDELTPEEAMEAVAIIEAEVVAET